jgi:hypothetical protein
MNEVAIFDRQTCSFARKNESCNLKNEVDSSASVMAASDATPIKHVYELSANAIGNFQTRYLQLKKQNIAS